MATSKPKKPRKPREVQYGPKEKLVFYGPKKRKPRPVQFGPRRPKFLPRGDAGATLMFSSSSLAGKLKGKSGIRISGSAELYFNGDARHLVDALRTAIGIHTGRAAGAAVRPDNGKPHGQSVSMRGATYTRDLRQSGRPDIYWRTFNEKGKPNGWARSRYSRSGKTAAGWRVGKITGSKYSASAMVYPSDEVGPRAAAMLMLANGYDLHSVDGDVAKLIGGVVRSFMEGSIGPKITVPTKPPTLAARAAHAVDGSAWMQIK